MDDGWILQRLLTVDIDGDGRISPRDVLDWLAELMFIPGDALIYLLLTHAPGVARVFHVSPADYGSTESKFVSIVTLLILSVVCTIVFNAIRNFDHALTRFIVARYQDCLRLLRVTRRRVTSWLGQRRQRRTADRDAIEVGDLRLGPVETAILKCYANADELHVVTPSEIAAVLRLSPRQMQPALRRLLELDLISRGFGTNEGEEGHRISKAGQIYLLSQ